jgi:hypothetical protein
VQKFCKGYLVKKLKIGLKTYSGHMGPTKVKKGLKPKRILAFDLLSSFKEG